MKITNLSTARPAFEGERAQPHGVRLSRGADELGGPALLAVGRELEVAERAEGRARGLPPRAREHGEPAASRGAAAARVLHHGSHRLGQQVPLAEDRAVRVQHESAVAEDGRAHSRHRLTDLLAPRAWDATRGQADVHASVECRVERVGVPLR